MEVSVSYVKNSSLCPCTFEARVITLKVSRKCCNATNTYISDYNCDIVKLLLCLHPGNLNKNLIDIHRYSLLSWLEFKNEADIMVSTLKEAGRTLYNPLPSGKSVPFFNRSTTDKLSHTLFIRLLALQLLSQMICLLPLIAYFPL